MLASGRQFVYDEVGMLERYEAKIGRWEIEKVLKDKDDAQCRRLYGISSDTNQIQAG